MKVILDALNDCLTELTEVEISFVNTGEAGDYFQKVRKVFLRAEKGNAGIHICL